MEFYTKSPFTNERRTQHIEEFERYQKSLPSYILLEDQLEFLLGFLSTVGLHPAFLPELDAKERVWFFPFLDPFWYRAGRVWMPTEDVAKTRMMELRLKLSSCLTTANKRAELDLLVDPASDVNLSNWYRLGGSE